MRRVLRYDGLLPYKVAPDGTRAKEEMTPDDIREMKRFIAERRTATTPFDIVWEGETPGGTPDEAAAIVRPWAEAGATWWMESRWNFETPLAEVRTRIEQGPPRAQ